MEAKERLTFLNGDDVPCVTEDKCMEEQSGHYCGPAIDRLAAYEDTRQAPEEIYSLYGEWCAMMSVLNSIGSYDRLRELAEADRDGRVVVLPCKVGDTVWMCEEDFGIVLPYTIDLISFVDKGCGYSANCNQNGELIDSIDFEDDDIGKTVFLTREEAEKALEETKRDG